MRGFVNPKRINLSEENAEKILQLSFKTGLSCSYIVNYILNNVELKVPELHKEKVVLESFGIKKKGK